MTDHDIGLIGLAVMGQNLALNIANHGFSIGVYNRSPDVTTAFIDSLAEAPSDRVADGTPERLVGYTSLADFVSRLQRPRRIMLMVKAGPAVDAVIDQLQPLLEPGDIIIDGGNSYFVDSNRRAATLKEAGLIFVGAGVSGGEEGALKGPSIMPGGDVAGWPHIKPIFQSIAAKVGPDSDIPCCEWVGEEGAGHYVKMVHNGIEYGDMQLICEAYFLLRELLGLDNAQLYEVFRDWNAGELDSYLIEITRDIFTVVDPDTGDYLVDKVLDTAKQKGTGKWMSQHALDLGVPTTLITEAVYARCLSGQKDARERASQQLSGPEGTFEGDPAQFIEDLRGALYASKLVSYAQGYVQLDAAAREFGWTLDNGAIAMLWRGGCIIRSVFLEDIKRAFDKAPGLENLLLDEFFRDAIDRTQAGWRRVVATAFQCGIPVPGLSAALTYYDGYRQARLPANLLQAQRDYFGAHTYERTDRPRGETFHTDWLGLRQLR
ncbi:decarboxylating NADP(+)-dependent phosphogluconate dehydrogenase [Parahaliea maris]|uniref:6-phosphogluconate dehydrogenase, decarboxylating n=1 Tax=Parahaliea maris TaxID=2716870 RepID=A0A5C9A041_9GAMM|nr:decarboxylating NADP(+)-dependent phosphogluconate dehydrogenase [Parahaliea maris]TXS94225.1 decarboxylating NADP(+)-dependent phosphogluconate dehydrogenase [Parahaliea maris]